MFPRPLLFLPLLVSLVCTPLAFGGAVELRDTQTGKVVATFDPATAKFVEIEGRKYAVQPLMAGTEQKARKIIIPKVEFRGATLAEALHYIDKRHVEAEDHKKPFNIVLVAPDLGAKRIDLSMSDVTCHSLLQTIAEMTGCEVVYEDERVALVAVRKR